MICVQLEDMFSYFLIQMKIALIKKITLYIVLYLIVYFHVLLCLILYFVMFANVDYHYNKQIKDMVLPMFMWNQLIESLLLFYPWGKENQNNSQLKWILLTEKNAEGTGSTFRNLSYSPHSEVSPILWNPSPFHQFAIWC